MIEKLQNLIDKNKDCFNIKLIQNKLLTGKTAFLADHGCVTDNPIYHTMRIGSFISEVDSFGFVGIFDDTNCTTYHVRYTDGY